MGNRMVITVPQEQIEACKAGRSRMTISHLMAIGFSSLWSDWSCGTFEASREGVTGLAISTARDRTTPAPGPASAGATDEC
jgi:hypothetical protein